MCQTFKMPPRRPPPVQPILASRNVAVPLNPQRLSQGIKGYPWKNKELRLATMRTLKLIKEGKLQVAERHTGGRWNQSVPGSPTWFINDWDREEDMKVPEGYVTPPISLPRAIRGHVYADAGYRDVDIVNCHFALLEIVCRQFNIPCPMVSEYVQDCVRVRTKLAAYMDVPEVWAKKLLIRLLYGGTYDKWAKDCVKEVGMRLLPPKDLFIIALQSELESIWAKFKSDIGTQELYKRIEGTLDKQKKFAPMHARVLSAYLLGIERRVIDACMARAEERGCRLAGYYYDGFIVSGADNNLLEAMGNYAAQQGYPVTFEYKPLEAQPAWTEELSPEELAEAFPGPPLAAFSDPYASVYDRQVARRDFPVWAKDKPYEQVREAFEHMHFKVSETNSVAQVDSDGEVSILKKEETKSGYPDLFYAEGAEAKPFLKRWIQDTAARRYDKLDFLPPPKHCPDTVYNMWSGFGIEFTHPMPALDTRENKEAVTLFKEHLEILAPGHGGYLEQFVAHIIQHPGDKPTRAHVFVSKQGAGKGQFKDAMQAMLGTRYATKTEGFKPLIQQFNASTVGKLVIFVDEVNKKEHMEAEDILKGLISETTRTVEQKFKDRREVTDFARYFLFTNRLDPIKMSEGDRRFAIFDCDESRISDAAYWRAMAARYSNPERIRAIFDHLKTVTVDIDFRDKATIPQTEARAEIMTAEWYIKFISRLCYNKRDSAPNGKFEFTAAQLEAWCNDASYCNQIGAPTSQYNRLRLGRYWRKVPGMVVGLSGPGRVRAWKVDANVLFASPVVANDDVIAGFEFGTLATPDGGVPS